MIVNPEKFQAIILGTERLYQNRFKLNIDKNNIESKSSVTLLGVKIDNKLKFDGHISTFCKKANNQLNAISRIQKYLNDKEKETDLAFYIQKVFEKNRKSTRKVLEITFR